MKDKRQNTAIFINTTSVRVNSIFKRKIEFVSRTIFAFIIIFSLNSCKNESDDPDRFKTGFFEIPAGKGYETTYIERQDSIQIETYKNKIDTLAIVWQNNFNYTLKMLNPKSAIDEEPIHVKITTLKKNSYEFEAVIGHSNYVQKGEIFKKSK